MKGKAGLLAGLAAGYVFGTRDGRQRYAQIKSQANRWWNDPRVQQRAEQAQRLAKKSARQATAKVGSPSKKSDSSTPTVPPAAPSPSSGTPEAPQPGRPV
jgi:hypothetical protein